MPYRGTRDRVGAIATKGRNRFVHFVQLCTHCARGKGRSPGRGARHEQDGGLIVRHRSVVIVEYGMLIAGP